MKSDSNKSFARTRIDAFYSLSFGLAIWLGIKKKTRWKFENPWPIYS